MVSGAGCFCANVGQLDYGDEPPDDEDEGESESAHDEDEDTDEKNKEFVDTLERLAISQEPTMVSATA